VFLIRINRARIFAPPAASLALDWLISDLLLVRARPELVAQIQLRSRPWACSAPLARTQCHLHLFLFGGFDSVVRREKLPVDPSYRSCHPQCCRISTPQPIPNRQPCALL